MNDDNPTGGVTCGHDRPGNGSTLAKCRRAAAKSCVCATSRLAPTHVSSPFGLAWRAWNGARSPSKVATGAGLSCFGARSVGGGYNGANFATFRSDPL